MRRLLHLTWLLLLFAIVAGAGFAARHMRTAKANGENKPGTTLRQIASFDLPGPPGKRFDYLTIDRDDGYLLSAHL